MIALREIVSRDIFKNFEIPEKFGDEFEMILVPIYNGESRILMNHQENNRFAKNVLSQKSEDAWNDEKENELFLALIYDTVIEDSDKEDEIWSKYL